MQRVCDERVEAVGPPGFEIMPLLSSNAHELLVALLTAAVIIAGLVLGKAILLPLAIAVVLAFILNPIVNAGVKRGAPRRLMIVGVVFAVLGFLGLGVFGLSQQLSDLARTVTENQTNIAAKIDSAGDAIGLPHLSRTVFSSAAPIEGSPAGDGDPDASAAMSMRSQWNVVSQAIEPLVQFGLVILFTTFILFQSHDVRDRIARIAGTQNLSRTTAALGDAASKLSKVFLAQAALNVATGVVTTLGLWAIGVPNPVVWGVLAAAMRYVPFVGTIITVLPPVILAAAIEPTWSTALIALALLVTIEFVVGHLLEPIVLGRSAGLTPLAMLCAAGFWAMVWGAPGLILAVPLTIVIVVLGRYVAGLEFANVLLSDEPALNPAEQFYHRLLANDAMAALELLDAPSIDETDSDVADQIILPALQFGAMDLEDGKIDKDRAQQITLAFDEILADDVPSDAAELEVLSESVAIIAARSVFDTSAVHYLRNRFTERFGSTPVVSSSAVGLTAIGQLPTLADVDLIKFVVLVSIGTSDSGYVPLLIKRIRQRVPGADIVVFDVGKTSRDPKIENGNFERLSFASTTRELLQRVPQDSSSGDVEPTALPSVDPTAITVWPKQGELRHAT